MIRAGLTEDQEKAVEEEVKVWFGGVNWIE
jgi:hypothetical protein